MRLKPLRGKTYKMPNGRMATYLDRMAGINGPQCRVIIDGDTFIIPFHDLPLPIIDTKDYEKIEDTKYKGD